MTHIEYLIDEVNQRIVDQRAIQNDAGIRVAMLVNFKYELEELRTKLMQPDPVKLP